MSSDAKYDEIHADLDRMFKTDEILIEESTRTDLTREEIERRLREAKECAPSNGILRKRRVSFWARIFGG